MAERFIRYTVIGYLFAPITFIVFLLKVAALCKENASEVDKITQVNSSAR